MSRFAFGMGLVLLLAGCASLAPAGSTPTLATAGSTPSAAPMGSEVALNAPQRERPLGEPIPAAWAPGGTAPLGKFEVGFATGTMQFHTKGSSLDDRTSARLFRIATEGLSPDGFGGGFDIEITRTDDDLFQNIVGSGSEVREVDFYPHFTYQMSIGDLFYMPFRFGPFYDYFKLNNDTTDERFSYHTFGARVAIEPDLLLIESDIFQWRLYSVVQLGAGGTHIDVNTPTVDDTFHANDSFFAGFEIGTRFKVESFRSSLSYIYRHRTIDDSNTRNGASIRATRSDLHAFLLMFGVVF